MSKVIKKLLTINKKKTLDLKDLKPNPNPNHPT